jgi:hypothetical protein
MEPLGGKLMNLALTAKKLGASGSAGPVWEKNAAGFFNSRKQTIPAVPAGENVERAFFRISDPDQDCGSESLTHVLILRNPTPQRAPGKNTHSVIPRVFPD